MHLAEHVVSLVTLMRFPVSSCYQCFQCSPVIDSAGRSHRPPSPGGNKVSSLRSSSTQRVFITKHLTVKHFAPGDATVVRPLGVIDNIPVVLWVSLLIRSYSVTFRQSIELCSAG